MAVTERVTVDDTDGNVLATLVFADAYFLERAITAWTGADAVKEAALVRATDFIDMRFDQRWTDETLALEEVPVKIQRACCEYALRALSAVLAPDPVVDDSGATVVTIASELGPLKERFQVLDTGVPALIRSYPAADLLILPYVKSAQGRTIR